GVIGVAAFRRFSYGVAGLAVFTGIGLAAALSRPTAQPVDVLPSLAGAAAGLLTLTRLVRAANADAAARPAPGGASAPPGAPPAPPGGLGRGGARAAADPATGGPGAPRQPAGAHGAQPAGAHQAQPGGPHGAQPTGAYRAQPGGARREQPVGADTGRRQFLVAGSVAVLAAGASGLVGRMLAERTNVTQARAAGRLPPPIPPAAARAHGADLQIPGLSPFVTPTGSFYRVDTALVLPEVPPSSWQLRIHGMVAHEMTLSFNELLRLPLVEDWITLCCVSNPVGGPYIGNAR